MCWAIGLIEGHPKVPLWKGMVFNISFVVKLTRIPLVSIASLEIDAHCCFCAKAIIDLQNYLWTGELVRKLTLACLSENIHWGLKLQSFRRLFTRLAPYN